MDLFAESVQQLTLFQEQRFRAVINGVMKMRDLDSDGFPEPAGGKNCLPSPHADVRLRGAKTSVTDHPGAGTTTILVVDDEEIVCMFLLAALQHRGFRTISALSGQDGLRCFSAHQKEIDLVISDIVMPDVSGYKMVEGIRAIRSDVPVMFITGTMQDVPLWAKRSCNVLRKPFTIQAFNTAVDECLLPRHLPGGDRDSLTAR